MSSFFPILCTPDQHSLIASYSMRFQKMIMFYAFIQKHFSDDLTRVDSVFPDRIIFYYPSKSGVNGAFRVVRDMNHHYTYDISNHDLEVARLICIDEKKRIELRFGQKTSDIPRDHLQQRGNYV